ncbi:hypothetical protein X747_27845 [Mesorhizobium sp. LNJC384A00]|uniref:DUF1402 family protein n=1 Tax=Mesorhizobium sp. LNJC384A00 TaxID=1287268 RepID=UPI0003CF1F28|nr:DUF1402 family protein [Mesorhizobium sp. LNJC384A00]ESY35930.1 hypothetical protein X747_27845 [Mesorhizobium sp. LNJC384A00]
MKKLILLILGLTLAATLFAADAATLVPAGNRNVVQPDIPGASSRRTQATNTTFQAKYRKVYALLQNDAELRAKIRKAAAGYGINPLHIVGAIVGEHTYNVDAYDRLQTYYVKAISYLSSKLSFAYDGEDITDFVQRPEFKKCTMSDSYDLWECREQVWNRSVHKVSGLPELDVGDPNGVYKTIMDPDLTLPYVAATIRKSIDAYKNIAGFDISGNPGLTATLYNVGNPEQRAYALKAENDKRRAAGETVKLPEENYYGWLVNDKLDELKALF